MNDTQPIIVRKVKKNVHGHHGGAWKVALADFTTAMMAFFMLLWLLGGASSEQKAAISKYFRNPSPNLGVDPEAPPQPMPEKQTALIEFAPTGAARDSDETDEGDEVVSERAFLEDLKNDLVNTLEAAPEFSEDKKQMLLDIMPEGLRIQIIDAEKRPMFRLADASLQKHTRALLKKLAPMLEKTGRAVSIIGHTDARPLFEFQKTNWELSTERANAARRALVQGGLAQAKVARVVGLAATVPLDKGNPRAALNRRVSIIVLNKGIRAADAEGEEDQSITVDQKTTALPDG